MKLKTFTWASLPKPAEYGSKGDLSLGKDLLAWLRGHIHEQFQEESERSKIYVGLYLPRKLAEAYSASDNPLVAGVGRSLLTGLQGSTKEAGRQYRDEWTKTRRRDRASAATIARSDQSNARIIEELDIATEILAQRPQLRISMVAQMVARSLRRNPETVRRHLGNAARNSTRKK
ncbi:MAG: hypothetical protein WD793_02620 [Steroidobacteraceae bacterium]